MRPATVLLSAVVALTGACAKSAGPTAPPSAHGRYYVDALAGNGGNPGDSAHPFQAVQQAANVVNPGDTVIVRNGVYTGGTAVLDVARGGTATNWVVFRAANKWGAILDGQGSLGVQGVSDAGVHITAKYVQVEGFEIRGVWHDGVDMGADYVQLSGNHIHDVGRFCTDGSFGISAVAVYANNLVIEQNLIHDIGRLGPGEAGCNPTTTYWQNHDHGLYMSGRNVIVRNNVLYKITRGWSIQLYSGSADQAYIVNNTFAFPNPNRVGQILVAEPLTNSVIANNVFYQALTAAISLSGGSTTNVTVANNITSNGPVWTGGTSGVTFASNLDARDPLLVNPAAFDFHLQAGSPAIGAGMSLSYVVNDFDGVRRPQGAGWDMGAFQFH